MMSIWAYRKQPQIAPREGYIGYWDFFVFLQKVCQILEQATQGNGVSISGGI